MGELRELSLTECLVLLFEGVVGRVAFSTPTGPRIVPVNYSIYQGDVLFRTTPYSELGTYGSNHLVVFEVDDLDLTKKQAWSIVAEGLCTVVKDPVLLNDIRRTSAPQPWAAGMRHLYLRLVWEKLTGRRLGESLCRAVPGFPTAQAHP